MPNTSLDTSDAIDLAEMLQLLADWLAAGPDHLDTSLTRFVGHPAHRASQLRTDLHRFVSYSVLTTVNSRSASTPADSHDWRVTL